MGEFSGNQKNVRKASDGSLNSKHQSNSQILGKKMTKKISRMSHITHRLPYNWFLPKGKIRNTRNGLPKLADVGGILHQVSDVIRMQNQGKHISVKNTIQDYNIFLKLYEHVQIWLLFQLLVPFFSCIPFPQFGRMYNNASQFNALVFICFTFLEWQMKQDDEREVVDKTVSRQRLS